MAFKFLDASDAPILDAVVDSTRGWRLTDPWRNWFGRLAEMFKAIPAVLNVVQLTAQAASIAATDFAGTTLLPGIYRASYRAQITQAATTSNSLTIAFLWTAGGVAQTATGAAITGNTVTTGQSDSYLVKVDKGTTVRYQTTYVSVGLTPMQYAFSATLEKVTVSA